MKSFGKFLCFHGFIPFVSIIAAIVPLFFGVNMYGAMIVAPVVTVLIYIGFMKRLDLKFALKLNACTLLVYSVVFLILLAISKGNPDNVLVGYSIIPVLPVTPLWIIGLLMNRMMEAYVTALLIYLSAAVTCFIAIKEKPALKYTLIFAGLLMVALSISSIAYFQRPAAKYGGHGFKYMHGFSSTDFTDYTVYAKNSKLAPVRRKPDFTIEGVENMPVMDGAEACYPLYAAIAKALYKDIDVIEKEWLKDKENNNANINGRVVSFTNTVVGFQRLVRGGLPDATDYENVELFFGARPSESQLQWAEELGVSVDITKIGKEAFVFFVEKDNPVSNVSAEDMRKIYHGDITNWKELGGKDSEIIAFQRPNNSGSQTMMVYFMGDTSLKEPKTYETVDSMVGVIDHVAEYHSEEGALGYSFRYFIEGLSQEKNVKLLSIDGVEPTVENIENGSYPLTVDLCLITRAEDTNPNIEKVKDFILSDEGQYLVYETGYGRIN